VAKPGVETSTNQTNCGNCSPTITWTTPEKGTRTIPPENTLAMVVDVRSSRGAIRIFETSSGEYVDGGLFRILFLLSGIAILCISGRKRKFISRFSSPYSYI
jgi:hypothetical protein